MRILIFGETTMSAVFKTAHIALSYDLNHECSS